MAIGKTRLVGILNLTPDSFSDGGKFNNYESALTQLNKIIRDGADIIDIGAESTRPYATPLTPKEEWSRLENILPELIFEVKKFNKNHGKNILTSIDSYHFENIQKSYEIGLDIINDIKGLSDGRIAEFVASKGIITILMHNHPLKVDENLIINRYKGSNLQIIDFVKEKLAELKQLGVKKSQLIFDPGIGFNKNALQSIYILKNITDFCALEMPIYVGHSKKSFLDKIDSEGDRAAKTLAVSKFLIEKNIDFIRIHDVENHKKLLH